MATAGTGSRRKSKTTTYVIAEAQNIADADIADTWDEDGQLIFPHKLPAALSKAVKSFRAHPTNGVQIEMHSKLDALDKLGKLHKLFQDNNQVTNNTLIVNQINEAVGQEAGSRAIDAALSRAVGRSVTLAEAVAALRAKALQTPGPESPPALRLVKPEGGEAG